jgi:phage shock protein C
MEGRLTRSRRDVMVGGVCSGIGRWMKVDPTVVRVVFALVSLFSTAFPGLIVYLVLWAILPVDPEY